jgi:hypothetical protein
MATKKKEVILYGIIINCWAKSPTAELYELKALETEKQYQLDKDTKYFYISRINKSALISGIWIDEYADKFIGTTKQGVIRAVIEYFEGKINDYEAKIARTNKYIEEVKKLKGRLP